MYPVGKHPFYSYTEEDKQIVLESVGIKENQLNEDANAVIDWVQMQPHLAEAGIESRAAASHVLTAKGSVERARQKIDFYYRERSRMSEIKDRIKLLKDQTRPIWNTHIVVSAPKLYQGSRVTFTKIFDWDNFRIEDIVVNLAMIADIRYANDISRSEFWVIDYKDATLAHLMKVNFVALNKVYWIMRDGLGFSVSAIHVVNCGAASTVQFALNFMKQFLSKKVVDRIKFHESPEALYEYLPKEYLPEDYGGALPSFEVLKDKMEKMLTDEKTKQFLLEACNTCSDESKRPKTEYCEDYLQGNFKKLELD